MAQAPPVQLFSTLLSVLSTCRPGNESYTAAVDNYLHSQRNLDRATAIARLAGGVEAFLQTATYHAEGLRRLQLVATTRSLSGPDEERTAWAKLAAELFKGGSRVGDSFGSISNTHRVLKKLGILSTALKVNNADTDIDWHGRAEWSRQLAEVVTHDAKAVGELLASGGIPEADFASAKDVVEAVAVAARNCSNERGATTGWQLQDWKEAYESVVHWAASLPSKEVSSEDEYGEADEAPVGATPRLQFLATPAGAETLLRESAPPSRRRSTGLGRRHGTRQDESSAGTPSQREEQEEQQQQEQQQAEQERATGSDKAVDSSPSASDITSSSSSRAGSNRPRAPKADGSSLGANLRRSSRTASKPNAIAPSTSTATSTRGASTRKKAKTTTTTTPKKLKTKKLKKKELKGDRAKQGAPASTADESSSLSSSEEDDAADDGAEEAGGQQKGGEGELTNEVRKGQDGTSQEESEQKGAEEKDRREETEEATSTQPAEQRKDDHPSDKNPSDKNPSADTTSANPLDHDPGTNDTSAFPTVEGGASTSPSHHSKQTASPRAMDEDDADVPTPQRQASADLSSSPVVDRAFPPACEPKRPRAESDTSISSASSSTTSSASSFSSFSSYTSSTSSASTRKRTYSSASTTASSIDGEPEPKRVRSSSPIQHGDKEERTEHEGADSIEGDEEEDEDRERESTSRLIERCKTEPPQVDTKEGRFQHVCDTFKETSRGGLLRVIADLLEDADGTRPRSGSV